MDGKTPSPYQRLTPGLEKALTRMNFYHFCQVIERMNPDRPPLGSTSRPADDPIRLLPHPGMGFPAGELKTVNYPENGGPPVIRTNFMGLYGVDAPLPGSYLDDISQRTDGHEALQGFLDIFNHRILTQFYRIWRKYSYPATFETGGRDQTSQSVLGLVGLGIPGTGEQIATPASRFLALLGILRLPGRTEEGIRAIVRLLAPLTSVCVVPHCIRRVPVMKPLGFTERGGFILDGSHPLGDEGWDAESQLLIELSTGCRDEAHGWLPDGQLFQDFQVMLRVYLGWRYRARIRLCLATPLMIPPALGEVPFCLGMTGVLGADQFPDDLPPTFTIETGSWAGMQPALICEDTIRVNYRF